MMSVMVLASVLPYMAPTIVAAYRDHPNKTSIFVTNLLAGWTVVGWIVALIWALSGPPGGQPVAAIGDEIRTGGLRLQGRDPRLDSERTPPFQGP